MKEFFEEYKRYIIKNSNNLEYKPTNENKYNPEKLYDVKNKINIAVPCTLEDEKAINDFIEISNYIHKLYKKLYNVLKDNFKYMNLGAKEIAAYIIAGLNREYKVIWDKRSENLKQLKNGESFLFSDMMNFKIESAVKEVGMIEARGALESMSDAVNLILNYLRYFIDTDMSSCYYNPKEFAARLIHSIQQSQQTIVLKQAYDDILYNGGFIEIDKEKKEVIFKYENYYNLKLLKAGNLMFMERRVQMLGDSLDNNRKSRLLKYVTNYRLKKPIIKDGVIKLSFGQGDPKDHKAIVEDMQNAIDAFYEFLDGSTILPKISNCTMDEIVSIWSALKYISLYVIQNVNYNITLITKEDFSIVPSKIKKEDLILYISKLTGIKNSKVKSGLCVFEASWTRYNDIWSSMLYTVNEFYLLPFYPILFSSPYYVIDKILERGGVSLDERGKQFEKYIYSKLTDKETSYPIKCMPPETYGIKGNKEEIDVLISMKNIIVVGDAKCIHYSMEPRNYYNAWERLKEGCEQVLRKLDFINNNPEYFINIEDITKKILVPVVITNYPTYTGFEYKGVYIIDSISFLAYIKSGIMTFRSMQMDSNQIFRINMFYSSEDEYSDNFNNYLYKNPLKQEFIKKISITDQHLLPSFNNWKIYCKTAVFNNNPKFNLLN